MAEFMRDPDLNRLVQELNDARLDQKSSATLLAASSMSADVSEEHRVASLLAEMLRMQATDLLLMSESAPVFRVSGTLITSDAPPLEEAELREMFLPHLTTRHTAILESEGAVDLSLRVRGGDTPARFRVNLHRQRGTLAAAVRMLPLAVPTLEALGLPAVLGELVAPARGLVLVCGPTGSGKTTTLAAMLDHINRRDARHVITIEDPIEYEHDNRRSIIEQIEVGRDTASFNSALRSALRQDPDVILVGEMRDLETIATSLTAAETGHLILSTLHTSDVSQAVNRIIDVFPPGQQSQVRQQLALSLSAIVCQQLVPRSDGKGRAAAFEIVVANYAIRNHIRRDKLQNLYSEITLGKRAGMVTMEESLGRLVNEGIITAEEARMRASKPDELEAELRGR